MMILQPGPEKHYSLKERVLLFQAFSFAHSNETASNAGRNITSTITFAIIWKPAFRSRLVVEGVTIFSPIRLFLQFSTDGVH